VSEDDSRTITEAVESAKKTRLDLDKDLFDFFRDILLLRVRGDLETELVMRFQQLTGPVMAKGVEDTAFYCFNRLVALNEVEAIPDVSACRRTTFIKRAPRPRHSGRARC
jgi:(1->4)-alpha-D-glucan 1-alpha-D-glucosylmutase